MLGELEQLVLIATLRLGDGAYGAPIQRVIQREMRRPLTAAAVYKTLARLEAKELVASRVARRPRGGAAAERAATR